MYGMACPGSSQEFTTCGASCWMEWSAWTGCSATCMGGQRSRSRDCNYIAEVGQQCIGNSMETEDALLVSVKYGPVGKPGQYVLATLAKCAVMDHVLVSVVVLVSLANQVAAGTQSKRAHAL